MGWTQDQLKAIDYKERKNVLLSAAAGSGKTTVLVERILRMITREVNPVSVSSLLVLTFTEAAATEMKQRIKVAIRDALSKDPENKHLRQQSLLVSSASISTVDSFCKRKLSEFIHFTDLPADFSVISETEATVLLKKAVDDVLEKYYSNSEKLPAFRDLCTSVGNGKNNELLKEILISLYKFSESMPYPVNWLSDSVKNYKTYVEKGSLSENQEMLFQNEIKELVFDGKKCLAEIAKLLEEIPKDHKYYGFYSAETEIVSGLLEGLEKGNFKDEDNSFKAYDFKRKVASQKTYPTEELLLDGLRDEIKKIFEEITELLKAFSPLFMSQTENTYKRVKTLKNIILCIRRKYKKFKREKGGLDFSDLEHEFLKLIADKDHNPTAVCLELRERYSEILLDEYQDTNNIQDEIFRLISGDNKNIFMVGDIKQSIYKFRNAVPKLFTDKYEEYNENKEDGEVICLSKNFRSRDEVINTVNYVFSGLMTKSLGDVSYDENECLVKGAEYPQPDNENDFETEFYLIKDKDDDIKRDIKEAEAQLISKRINELLASSFKVFDKREGKMRPVEFRDIVVLLRNRSSALMIEAVLERNGIPVYTDTGKSYLSSREVSTVLAFLSIIDNPYQDIPLIATLRSPIFSFTNEELAKIRLYNKKAYFYDALVMAKNDGNKEAEYFLSELDYFRNLAEEIGIYSLILNLYERYNYTALVSLMKFPEHRRANLRLLLMRALEFEKSKLTGLFGFMNYLESIREDEKDLSPAKVISESENVVRIMTIHKSKGLEFPVVFLADTNHKFNTMDLTKPILWHEQGGISLVFSDVEKRIKYPSPFEMLIKSIKRRELKSEEMRLLYVALTRAKEKLIITSAYPDIPKKPKIPTLNAKKIPVSSYLKRANSMGSWLYSALISHPFMRCVREVFSCPEDIAGISANFRLRAEIFEALDDYKAIENENISFEKSDKIIKLPARVMEMLSFSPENNENIPVKMTVTEVKRRLVDNDDFAVSLMEAGNIYLKSKEEISPSEKGTITHFVLQYIDEKSINSKDDIEKSLDIMQDKKILSKAQREVADVDGIFAFFETELGKRLRNSKRCEKEFSFYSKKQAGEIFETLSDEGKKKEILLQGTIDCFFEDRDGKLVLVDYKTDNVDKVMAGVRADEYRIQIECYREALELIEERKVDECYIYFLNCNETVRM